MARELSALGPEIAPFLLEVLTRRGVPVGGPDPERRVVLAIPPEIEEIVLAALSSLPREPLLRLLRTSAASKDVEERVACLRLLGRIGTHEHLDLLASLASPTGTSALVPPKMRTAFQEALASVIARDHKAFTELAGLYARIPPALIFPMVRAAESEAPRKTMDLLSVLLGARADADVFLLSEMAGLADAHSIRTSEAVRQKTRRYLDEGKPERLQAAAALAGALDDGDTVPELTKLLGHPDPKVVRSARSALKRIARKDHGRSPAAWTKWYETESEWWNTKAASASHDLTGSDPAKAAAAILELGSRRLRRDEAALLLAEGLKRPETDLVTTCCRALGHLGSPAALPALEEAERSGDLGIRATATEALAQIRGPKGGATAVPATRHRSAGE